MAAAWVVGACRRSRHPSPTILGCRRDSFRLNAVIARWTSTAHPHVLKEEHIPMRATQAAALGFVFRKRSREAQQFFRLLFSTNLSAHSRPAATRARF